MSRHTILVTGGAGFIGSNFVIEALNRGFQVVNLDKLTYAGNLDNLKDISQAPGYTFVCGDIGDRKMVERLLHDHAVDWIVNFAAESHVDRSIDAPAMFIETNVVGTFQLLEAALAVFRDRATEHKQRFRFLHVSTDEVYGSLGPEGTFTEDTAYAPNSPYSASKAASDHLVRAYHHTYGLPCLTTNCSNNYGPFQFPEKLIPVIILKALQRQPIPIYGDGGNIRDWLFVTDHCHAILEVLDRGTPGETYNIGGNSEKTNLELAYLVCGIMDQIIGGPAHADLITFVPDRPGHDRRYAVDSSKIRRELGWQPRESFESGLKKTVAWYLEHRSWCDRILDGRYRLERLGLDREEQPTDRG